MDRSPYERLHYFITDYLAMKLRPFEESLGLTNSRLRKALEKKSVSSEILEQIFSKYPNLNANWIFRGKGKMILDKENELSIAAESESQYVTRDELKKMLEEINKKKSP
jgi:hypothetical protein